MSGGHISSPKAETRHFLDSKRCGELWPPKRALKRSPLETLTWYSIDADPITTACILSYTIDSTCPRPLIAREERRLQTVPSRDSPAHLPGSMASNISFSHLNALNSAIHPSDTHPPAFEGGSCRFIRFGTKSLITESRKQRRAPRQESGEESACMHNMYGICVT
jgi:hypothetical protein